MIKTKTQFEKFPDNSRFSSLVDPLRMRYTALCYIEILLPAFILHNYHINRLTHPHIGTATYCFTDNVLNGDAKVRGGGEGEE